MTAPKEEKPRPKTRLESFADFLTDTTIRYLNHLPPAEAEFRMMQFELQLQMLIANGRAPWTAK